MPPSEGHSRHAPKGGRTPHERSPLVSVATDAEETKDKEPARKPDRRGLITLVLVLLSAVMLFVSTTFELDDKHPKATEGLFIMLVTVMWFVSEVLQQHVVHPCGRPILEPRCGALGTAPAGVRWRCRCHGSSSRDLGPGLYALGLVLVHVDLEHGDDPQPPACCASVPRGRAF